MVALEVLLTRGVVGLLTRRGDREGLVTALHTGDVVEVVDGNVEVLEDSAAERTETGQLAIEKVVRK